MQKLVFIAVISILVAGCNSSKDGNSPLVAQDTAYIEASCEFSPDEGQESTMSLLSTKEIKTASFGKEYDRAKLKGVLKASVNSSLDFIKGSQVNVFKKPTDNGGCPNLSKAQPMPERVARLWNIVESPSLEDEDPDVISQSGTSSILGIYVGKTSSAITGTGESLPFIAVRENVPRWALVHEYMHHLFTDRAEELNYNDYKMFVAKNESKITVMELLEQSSMGGSERTKLVNSMKEWAEQTDKFMLHYYLEEMTIESLLRKEFEAKNLMYVTSYGYNNAVWYIRSSGKIATSIYDGMLKKIESVIGKVNNSDASSEEKKAHLEKLEIFNKRFALRKEQILLINTANSKFMAESEKSATSKTASGISTSIPPSQSHHPCGRMADSEKILKLIEDGL